MDRATVELIFRFGKSDGAQGKKSDGFSPPAQWDRLLEIQRNRGDAEIRYLERVPVWKRGPRVRYVSDAGAVAMIPAPTDPAITRPMALRRERLGAANPDRPDRYRRRYVKSVPHVPYREPREPYDPRPAWPYDPDFPRGKIEAIPRPVRPQPDVPAPIKGTSHPFAAHRAKRPDDSWTGRWIVTHPDRVQQLKWIVVELLAELAEEEAQLSPRQQSARYLDEERMRRDLAIHATGPAPHGRRTVWDGPDFS